MDEKGGGRDDDAQSRAGGVGQRDGQADCTTDGQAVPPPLSRVGPSQNTELTALPFTPSV